MAINATRQGSFISDFRANLAKFMESYKTLRESLIEWQALGGAAEFTDTHPEVTLADITACLTTVNDLKTVLTNVALAPVYRVKG
jgi:hypothetical protein